jgi:predicted phage baseplate assembly protein
VPAQNLSTVREEIVGISEGYPDQTFELRRKPAQPGSLDLWIEVEGQEPERWRPVEDFLASGPEDPHYRLNATAGMIHFGDGRRGRIPVAGAEIIAREYRYGGGTAGNVGVGLINTPLTSLVGVEEVTNEWPAVGGRDEQDVEELKEQAPRVLRSRNRAVTDEDFTALAEQAGGVAKATTIPLAHPAHPGVEVPGAVTVVIVPDNEDIPPRPSSDLIRHVCRYLNRFRLLTTEVYVKGPAYQAIKVEARVAAQPYAAFDAVALDVVAALNGFLDPLGREASNSNGQPTGERGWRFGQELYPTSLYSVILGVDGVAAVPSLALIVNGRPHDNLTQPVIVPLDGLVYGADHEITVVPLTDL